MPVTIRRDGATVSRPKITQEQRDMLWGRVLAAYLRAHPEMMNMPGEPAAAGTDNREP